MKYTAGFIGVGNMGGALLDAVAGRIGAGKCAVFDIDKDKARFAAERTGADVLTLEKLASECRFIFLGVKPNTIRDLCLDLRDTAAHDATFITMAAGTDIEYVSKALGSQRVIRIMPNTPVGVNEGMILYCTVSDLDSEAEFLDIISGCGKIDKLDQKLIDAAAALSGCGPAFVYMFIEALADGAVSCGLPRQKALLYAQQTVLGAAKLAVESKKHPGVLKDEVCSPGGTTISGVLELEKSAFRYAAANAVKSAYKKTFELKN